MIDNENHEIRLEKQVQMVKICEQVAELGRHAGVEDKDTNEISKIGEQAAEKVWSNLWSQN
jgi:hypothetical protein